MGGYPTVVCSAWLAAEEAHMVRSSLAALEEDGVKKCGMTDVFVFVALFTCRLHVERCGTPGVYFVV